MGSTTTGACPEAGLILSGKTLYGTATVGGSSGNGTVFAVNTNGSVCPVRTCTGGSDGTDPTGNLIFQAIANGQRQCGLSNEAAFRATQARERASIGFVRQHQRVQQ